MFYVVLSAIILGLVALATFALLKKNEVQTQLSMLEQEFEDQETKYIHEIDGLRKELSKLERIRHIPDIIEKANKLKEEIAAKLEHAQRRADEIVLVATKEAQNINKRLINEGETARAKATETLRTAEQQANEILQDAEKKVKELVSQTRREVKEKNQKAEDALNQATVYAFEITQRAEKKAEEIGGKAYEAMKKHEFYESAAQAMHNVVKGYGDRYMVPATSLLDEWAEEYGFHEAGERLRLARERTKIMEKNRTAATCDYAEAMRREFAINFVLDAFNGKVDSILSRVKHDNYGKLSQEIRDAFHLVNFNGKAFRDARIMEEFLEARLDELKWAEVVQQFRLKEREEQRMIREQIREEEKARREYERAVKQARRDEEMLSKALEKVRQEYAAASVEERSKYESRIQELNAKLLEAEERNKRALSMAQQTKCGHVYIISNLGSFGEHVYKIGLTRRLEPTDRVRELSDASVPFSFDIHALIYSEDAPALESDLHKRFLDMQVNKVNPRKEFFRVGLQDIRETVEEMGLEVKWTLTAEAKEYRETLALEHAMREDPGLHKRWLEEQSAYETRHAFELGEDADEDEEVLNEVDVL